MLLTDNSETDLNDLRFPTVSIGMPVYNAEATISKAIESILSQSYVNFELIISDNASTDATESICIHYQAIDSRVRFFRQEVNLGAGNNFHFVFNKARCIYFMWAAADDTRTNDFLMETVLILENNPTCVFATTPNCFEGEEMKIELHQRFELKGGFYQKMSGFMNICWHSHGCFYSLIRRDALLGIPYITERFLAADWAVIICLLSKGEFLRTQSGLQILGCSGSSMQPNYLSKSIKSPIEHFAPLFYFSSIFKEIIFKEKKINKIEKIRLILKLLNLNLVATKMKYIERISNIIKSQIRKI